MRKESAAYSRFKRKLKDVAPRSMDFLMRVENVLCAGTPDVYVTIDGVPSWIEFKAPNLPARHTTKVFASAHGLNHAQMLWLSRHRAAGGTAWVMVAGSVEWFLIDAKHAYRINTMNRLDLFRYAVWNCRVPIDADAWRLLREALAGRGKPATLVEGGAIYPEGYPG